MAVKYGRHGGVSGNNKDWKSYYGAEAYDKFVAQKKKERELIPKKNAEEVIRKSEYRKAILNDPDMRQEAIDALYEAEYEERFDYEDF